MIAASTQQTSAAATHLNAADAASDPVVQIQRSGKPLATALLKGLGRLLSPDWRIPLWSKQTRESIIASLGAVELRQAPAGCLAVTLVKGDFTPARGTALVRLAKYLGGENQSRSRLDAERPVLQQRKAPGLWQVGLRLSEIDDVRNAPLPRGRKVKPVAQQPTTWAVLTRFGRPSEQKFARAELEVLDAIARTRWFAAGPTIVRIYGPTSILQFAGIYEVAVPVTCKPEAQRTAYRAPISRPAETPSLAVD
jgi:SOUL heme-binding protein